MKNKHLPWGTFSIVWILAMLFFAQEYWFRSITNDQNQYNFLLERLVGLDRKSLLIEHQWWRIATSFLIQHDVFHLTSNLALLIIAAYFVEKRKGTAFLLALFIFSGIGGSLFSIILNEHGNISYVGSSGGVYGVIFALILIRAIELFNVKGEWIAKFAFCTISLLTFWFLLINVDRTINISSRIHNHNAHIGGAISGVFFLLIYTFTPARFKKILYRLYLFEITATIAVLIFRFPSTAQEYESYNSYILMDSKARNAFIKEDFKEAKKIWANLSEQFPKEWVHYRNIASCCYNLKDYPCAKINLDKAIALQPEDIQSTRLRAGIAFYLDKDYLISENLYSNIVNSSSAEVEDYKLLIVSILKKNFLTLDNLDNPKGQEKIVKIISEGLNKFPNDLYLLKLGFNSLALNTDNESLKTLIGYGLTLIKLKALPPQYLDRLVIALGEGGNCTIGKKVLDSYQFKGLPDSQEKNVSLLVDAAKELLYSKCPKGY